MIPELSKVISLTAAETLTAFGAKADGLTAEEVAARQKKYGLNVIHTHKLNGWVILWRQITSNPLVLILVAATGVSYATGSHISAYYIFGLITASIVLGFWNEFAAERTVRLLLKRVSLAAIVVRGGAKVEVPVEQVTIGDIVMLASGSIVPADLRLIETGGLQIDQSVLTGESDSVEKNAEVISVAKINFADFSNVALMGTVVASGWGKGVAVAIDQHTEFGRIAEKTTFVKPETSFQKGLRQFGNLILRVVLIFIVAVFSVNALLGHPIIESTLFALAIAVGMTPELLPVIVTISLSHGAGKLAKKHVVAKQLISIENLGNMDVLCTDKTGTLTEGNIHVVQMLPAAGRTEAELGLLGVACNDAIMHHKWIGNPIDIAQWLWAEAAGAKLPPDLRRVAGEPFDYEQRAMFAVLDRPGADGAAAERRLVVKGAPEAVLARCAADQTTAEAAKTFAELSKVGMRVIALADRPVDVKAKYDWTDPAGLEFRGLVVLRDIPKLSAKESLDKLERLNVAIKILTGDSSDVTQHICNEVGLAPGRIVEGDELAAMTDDQLRAALPATTVFARVTPSQKLRVIQQLQKLGHSVGYLGDGINDAPALHSADVGISVDTAVDVAKDAAPIVLLRKGLDTIADGIVEGRRTFANTIKYVLMGTSSDFGNAFSAAGASFVLPFLPMLPTQILLTDGLYALSQVTIPSDNVDLEELRRPRQWNVKFIKYYMLFFGPISSVYDFLTFGVMLFVFHASGSTFQTGWFVESLATEVLVIFVIRTARTPFYKSKPGKWLTATCLGVAALGLLLPYSPLAAGLGLVPLAPVYLATLMVIVLSYLALVGTLKHLFLKRFSV